MSRHWHVLGAGAIGCLFADALARAGTPVTLLLREAQHPEGVLHIEDDDNTRDLTVPLSATSAAGTISHLLVTTKAYDVEEAVADVAHRLVPGTQLLLMINGMGLAERLQLRHHSIEVFCGITTEGAFRTGPLQICHAGRGTTRIGSLRGSSRPDWLHDWIRAIPTCAWEPEVDAALWHKLAINCAINPLTALHRCHNGELSTRPELALQVQALCDEISAISHAAGFTDTAEGLHAAVAGVIAGTAANRSSMLQDVLSGRHTEIDHITGYLLEVARTHRIDAPLNRQLLEEVTRLAP